MDNVKTEVYLVRFENKAESEVRLVAVGDMYDTLSYSFMKTECEYKDLSDEVMQDGWTFEKKVIEVAW